MRYALAYAALVSTASAHGVVTMIKGDNGVMMPGLSSTYLPPDPTAFIIQRSLLTHLGQSLTARPVTAPPTAAVRRPTPPSSATAT